MDMYLAYELCSSTMFRWELDKCRFVRCLRSLYVTTRCRDRIWSLGRGLPDRVRLLKLSCGVYTTTNQSNCAQQGTLGCMCILCEEWLPVFLVPLEIMCVCLMCPCTRENHTNAIVRLNCVPVVTLGTPDLAAVFGPSDNSTAAVRCVRWCKACTRGVVE